MQFNVLFLNVNRKTSIRLTKWLYLKYGEQTLILDDNAKVEEAQILFFHVQSLFDWLHVRRLNRKHGCKIIVLLDEELLHTSPLGMEERIHALLITPVKKTHFYRCMNKLFLSMNKDVHSERTQGEFPLITSNATGEQLDTIILGRIVSDSTMDQQDFLHAFTYFSSGVFPNVVIFIQGFIHPERKVESEPHVIQLIKSHFSEAFEGIVPKIYFLPFQNHLLLLFKKPDHVETMSTWQEGRTLFSEVSDRLRIEHQIQIYIGVGSCYTNPELLSRSYQEAKKARSAPQRDSAFLRYFDEIPKSPKIVNCTAYITEHLDSELLAQDVAIYANLSYSYFSQLFKRETGRGFSEYLTLARLQQSVWMLRHSNNTIEEIADYVGFNTPNYFSTVFKRYVGVTPSEFKQTSEIFFL